MKVPSSIVDKAQGIITDAHNEREVNRGNLKWDAQERFLHYQEKLDKLIGWQSPHKEYRSSGIYGEYLGKLHKAMGV